MARAISGALKRSLLLQVSGAGIIAFLTIEHADLAEPIRVACDGVDYVRDGETFIGFPFKFGLLTDDESPPRAQIEVQNADRTIGDALRGLTSPARLTLELISADEFDQTVKPRVALGTPPIEYSASNLFLVNVSVDAMTITGDVVSWDYTQDSWPARRATQDRFPGLFR